MNNVLFNISEIATTLHGDYMNNDITIIKVDHSNNVLLNNIIEEQFLTRLRENISCSFFVLDGELTATIDTKHIKQQITL